MDTDLNFSFISTDLNVNFNKLFVFTVLWVLTSFVNFLNPYKVPILVLAAFALFARILLIELNLKLTDEDGYTDTISVKGPNIALFIATLIMIFRYPIPFNSMTGKIIEAVIVCLMFFFAFSYNLAEISMVIDWLNSDE